MSVKILNVMLGKGKGGLENAFVSHARLFSKAGYEVVALCHQESSYVADLQNLKIPTYTMSASKFNPLAWIKLIRTIKSVRPDVVCLHGNRAVYFASSKILKLFIRPFPKLMATAHNNRNKFFYKLDGVFSITEVLKNNLIHQFNIPENKIFLCPNAAGFPEVKPAENYELHQPVHIGFCGRLHPVKGLDILLDACQKLKEKKIAFKLIVAGDGPLADDCKMLVHAKSLTEEVQFLGWISDKKSFFEQIDILCMPSRSEAQSLSLLEGLSYAKPVLVSTCPGMLEVVHNANCALSFTIEDSDDLCNKLALLIQDKALCSDFSKNAYKLFLAKYNEDVQMENLKKGIEAICKK